MTIKNKNQVCRFCEAKVDPTWEEAEKLREFLSPRSRILGRELTGNCVRHQRKLAEAIKRARHLALLPFTT